METSQQLLIKMYEGIKNKNRARFGKSTNFSEKEFVDSFIEDNDFNLMYFHWRKSGFLFKERPVPDRMNCFKHYTMDNIQILSLKDNSRKAGIEMAIKNINKSFKIEDKSTEYILGLINRIKY